MADEPERLMAGALLRDLEAQAAETPGLTVGPPDSMGMVYIEGLVDIHLLAQAAQEEAAEDQARADAEAERGRRGIPQTSEQIAAFATRWDARVVEGRKQ